MNKREFFGIGAVGVSCLLPLPAFGQESEEVGVAGAEINIVTNEEMAKLVCAHPGFVECTSEGGCIFEWEDGKRRLRHYSPACFKHDYSWNQYQGDTHLVDYIFSDDDFSAYGRYIVRRRKILFGGLASSTVRAFISTNDGAWLLHESLNLSDPNIRIIHLTDQTMNPLVFGSGFNSRYFGRLDGQWVELGV